MKRTHLMFMAGALLAVAAGCAKKTDETGSATAPADTATVSTATEAPAAVDEHGNSAEAVAPAGTASGIWQQIDAEHAKLAAAISAGSLGEVHHHAFAIRDLVAALPGASHGLSAAASTELAAGVKAIAKVADELDEAGDAGDLSVTQSGITALDASLATVRTLTGGAK